MRKGLLLVSKHYSLSRVLGLNKTTVMVLENERNMSYIHKYIFFLLFFFLTESFVCRLHQPHKTT